MPLVLLFSVCCSYIFGVLAQPISSPGYKFRFVNQSGQELGTLEADSVIPIAAAKYVVYRQGKAGIFELGKGFLVDTQWHGIVSHERDSLVLFYGLANEIAAFGKLGAALHEKGSWQNYKIEYGFLMLYSANVVDVYYLDKGFNFVGHFSSAKAVGNKRLAVRDKFGYKLVNEMNQRIGKNSFQGIECYQFGVSKVTLSGFCGLMDYNGNFRLGPGFRHLKVTSEQTVIVESEGLFGMIDMNGNEVIGLQTDTLQQLPNGLVISKNCGAYKVYSSAGCSLTQHTVRYFSIGSNGLTASLSTSGWEIADDTGGFWLENYCRAIEIQPFSEGLAVAKIEGKYGFLDKEGYVRISNRYEAANSFSEFLASVKLGGKWGIINKSEKLVVQPWYKVIQPFCKGLAVFKRDEKWGLLNSMGKEILFGYDSIRLQGNNYYFTWKGRKMGLVDSNGREQISPKYDLVKSLSQNRFLLKRNNQYGLCGPNAEIIIPVINNSVQINPWDNVIVITSTN